MEEKENNCIKCLKEPKQIVLREPKQLVFAVIRKSCACVPSSCCFLSLKRQFELQNDLSFFIFFSSVVASVSRLIMKDDDRMCAKRLHH